MYFSEKTVEFNIIKEEIKALTYSKEALNAVLNLKPSSDFFHVNKMLNETN